MNPFYLDILEQPRALRALADYYARGEGAARLAAAPRPHTPILTGMGASFHAAWIATQHLHALGIPAWCTEATDLLYYGGALLHAHSQLVFVSQSGASAEVAPILERLPDGATLMAVTNDPHSPLARRAQVVLPLLAGAETAVATRTYLNSLAVLWLLARQWGGVRDGHEAAVLSRVITESERLLAHVDTLVERWLEVLDGTATLLFLGHGPHAATARQAAMMVSEWVKAPALSASVGAFRHGFIEIAGPGLGAVVFAAPGRSAGSARALARELASYGARVLVVEHGSTRGWDEVPAEATDLDEFLSPILDIIPAQLFVEALARRRNIAPGFRYISKVITQV